VSLISFDCEKSSPSAPTGGLFDCRQHVCRVAGPGVSCSAPASDHQFTVLKIGVGVRPTITQAWCGKVSGAGSPIVTTSDGSSDPVVWMLGAEAPGPSLRSCRRPDLRLRLLSEELSGLAHGATGLGDNLADWYPRAMAAVETQGQDGESGDRPMYGFQRG
jgi:hypothetical protein